MFNCIHICVVITEVRFMCVCGCVFYIRNFKRFQARQAKDLDFFFFPHCVFTFIEPFLASLTSPFLISS